MQVTATRLLLVLSLAIAAGCGNDPEGESTATITEEVKTTESSPEPATAESFAPAAYEVDAESMLAAALPPEQLEQGWVRLFDGQSLAGWFMVGAANWEISDGVLKVSKGEPSFLCTSFQVSDYELQVDFRCDPDTNSGIFLRAAPEPQDVSIDCLELNIAPPDNPFPTGSFVQRKKLEPADLGNFDPTAWHTYRIRLLGDSVEVFLDGKQILEMSATPTSAQGHISLQHNSGRVEFRNILMRPLNPTSLSTGENWEDDWSMNEKEEGTFAVNHTEDGLHIVGGLGQLQSKQDYGNFILQAKYTLAKPEVNSGIFFRCIRETMLDGYECQVNHATVDGDPLRPADAGAGAIFRRQPARIVVGDGSTPTYITLLANGQQMVTWVNGIQVADFYDSREPDANPRKGSRTEPGPIAIQGHDPTTDATFYSIRISELN